MEEGKNKVSFGFSKSNKLTKLVRPVKIAKEKVDYVDAFDGKKGKFSYQGVLREEPKKELLVIPLIGTRSAYDVIKAKLEESGKLDGDNQSDEPVTVKAEKREEENVVEDVKPNLEALAAKEILASLNQNGENKEGDDSGRVIVPDLEKTTFVGEKESTLEDYENVPVGDYGLALLRGMGWTPQTGIGKDSKIVAPVTSKLRPKRLGLGAESSLLPPGEQPTIKRGLFVQIMAGEHKGSVGVVEGTDGDTGSVVIKLAEVGNVSLSENFVKVVTKKEYEQFLNGNGHVADPPNEKKYGINEKESSRNGESSVDVRIKKEETTRDRHEERRKERKARSISKSPERKKKSRSRDRRDDRRDRRQDRSSKRERSRSVSPKRDRSKERKKRRSVSVERKDKKSRRSSESEGRKQRHRSERSGSVKRERTQGRISKRERSRSDSAERLSVERKDTQRSPEKERNKRDRSREREEEDSGHKSRKELSSKARKKDDSEDSDCVHRRRSRSVDAERKKRSRRSSSGEEFSKKKSRRKDDSEEATRKKDKKKKKKSKKSRKRSCSSD